MKNRYRIQVLCWSLVLQLLPIHSMASDWKGPFEYKKFNSGFVVEKGDKDDPLYLGLAIKSPEKISLFDLTKHQTIDVDNQKLPAESEWVIAKVSKDKNGAFYVDGAAESYTSNYMLFLPDDPTQYKWVEASDGKVPEHAVSLAKNIDGFICRALWAEGYVPGVLRPDKKVCEFGYSGSSIRSYVYEVLVKPVALL